MTGFPRGSLASSCGWLPAILTILSGRSSMAFLLARTVFSRLASFPGVVLRQGSQGFFAGDVSDNVFPVAGLKALSLSLLFFSLTRSIPRNFVFSPSALAFALAALTSLKTFKVMAFIVLLRSTLAVWMRLSSAGSNLALT